MTQNFFPTSILKHFKKIHRIIYFVLILAQIISTIKTESLPINHPDQEIELAGYPSETHLVTTEDGYILTIFRIPGPQGSNPVLLMHGLLQSASDWLALGKRKSLAYILHDAGYDVWLGNARGNTYSKRHINLTTEDPQFWNFCLTEVGIYDLSAFVNYITNLSGKRLFYIDHSMGGTFLSIMAIERPDVAQKVKAMIGLAPGTFTHPKSLPLLALKPLWKELYDTSNKFHLYEFLPHGPLSDEFAEHICGSLLFENICSLTTFILAGYSPQQLDYAVQERFLTNFPAGTSVKLFVHFIQQFYEKTKFNKFNYGKKNNRKIYNSNLPPAYDLSKMRVPTAIFWAENDIIVVPKTVKEFYSQIPVKLGLYEVPDKHFNHLDFILGKDAPQLVYSTVLKIMSDIYNYNNK